MSLVARAYNAGTLEVKAGNQEVKFILSWIIIVNSWSTYVRHCLPPQKKNKLKINDKGWGDSSVIPSKNRMESD